MSELGRREEAARQEYADELIAQLTESQLALWHRIKRSGNLPDIGRSMIALLERTVSKTKQNGGGE